MESLYRPTRPKKMVSSYAISDFDCLFGSGLSIPWTTFHYKSHLLGSRFASASNDGKWRFYHVGFEKNSNLFFWNTQHILSSFHAYWNGLIVIIGGYFEEYGDKQVMVLYYDNCRAHHGSTDGLQLLFYAKNGNKITNKQIESGR
jgi:hypothetical protein